VLDYTADIIKVDIDPGEEIIHMEVKKVR